MIRRLEDCRAFVLQLAGWLFSFRDRAAIVAAFSRLSQGVQNQLEQVLFRNPHNEPGDELSDSKATQWSDRYPCTAF
jgi:hypothetical protein